MYYNDILENSINGLPKGHYDIAGFLTRTVTVVTFFAFSISFVMFAYSLFNLPLVRGMKRQWENLRKP